MSHKWYIVHAYSGFEKKVAAAISEKAKTKNIESAFSEIIVPTEEVVEVKKGKKRNAERKFFPGYVLTKMEMTDETYHMVKALPKVSDHNRKHNAWLFIFTFIIKHLTKVHNVNTSLAQGRSDWWRWICLSCRYL